MPFKEALKFSRQLKLKGHSDWEEWRKSVERPTTIPTHPEKIYKDEGWQGYRHWLGTAIGSVATSVSTSLSKRAKVERPHFLSFEDALKVSRGLSMKTEKDWRAWCAAGLRPANIPVDPAESYRYNGQSISH